MNMEETNYQKGFNNGYILSKHNPELYSKIMQGIDATDPYLQGMQEGQKQHEQDKYVDKDFLNVPSLDKAAPTHEMDKDEHE